MSSKGGKDAGAPASKSSGAPKGRFDAPGLASAIASISEESRSNYASALSRLDPFRASLNHRFENGHSTAVVQLRAFNDIFSCGLCEGYLCAPHRLGCGHRFCRACLFPKNFTDSTVDCITCGDRTSVKEIR
jgi:hypothetical protein